MALGYTPVSPSRSSISRRTNPKAQPYVAPEVFPEPEIDYSMEGSNARFPHELVAFIIRAHAAYTPAPEICTAVLREFGARIQPQQTYRFDPKRPAGKSMPEELLALFHDARAKFNEAIDDIPVASRSYRLSQLQKLYERATDEVTGNPIHASHLLEQAAKECGKAYERAVQVEHSGIVNLAPPVIQISFTDPREVFEGTAQVIDVTPEPTKRLTDGK